MTEQKQLQALKSVYSYFFPEVRRLVHHTDRLEDCLFFTNTPAEKAQMVVDSLDFKKQLVVPKTTDGKIDLDLIHEPAIGRIIEIYEPIVPGISDFKNRYFTPGSSQGIFHALAELKSQGVSKIFTLKGEYEGYKEYGKSLGIQTEEVDLGRTRIRDLERGVWFISNPSSKDGNIISSETIKELCDEGNKVFLDLAYVGSTKENVFDVSHENIPTVFMSFSKPYGLFRFRMGFTFSREPVNSLYANKWFKDIQRVLTSVKIAEEVGPRMLHPRYETIQMRIINQIKRQGAPSVNKSDVLLLGYVSAEESKNLSGKEKTLLAPYKRGGVHRLCLTPYYEALETEVTS